MDNLESKFKDTNDSNFKFTSVKFILEEIYGRNKKGGLTHLIQNANLITKILDFLIISNENSTNEEKIEMINFLTYNFRIMPQNMVIFTKYSINLKKENQNTIFNLIFILIDLYLNIDSNISTEEIFTKDKDKKKENSNFIEIDEMTITECLNEIISNIDITKEIFDYVYQKLALNFRLGEENLLSKKLLNKNLKLLSILYGEQSNSSNPCNYFYFTGNGSIKLSDQYLATKEDRKITSGCVITLWFKLNLDFVENNLNFDFSVSDIINIKCAKNQNLILSLHNNKLLFKNFSEKEYIHELPFNEWINLSLIIKPKSYRRGTEFVLVINDFIKSFPVPNFNCENEISEVSFFNNFCGMVTSIIFLNKSISEEYVKIFREYPLGIYKETILYDFLRRANNKYMDNSNLHLRSVLNSSKDSEGFTILMENLKFFYIPFRSSISSHEQIIYDVCGKYHAYTTNIIINGIHLNKKLQKNIFMLGGINTILPIVELMFFHSKRLLDVETFCYFMEIIFTILNYRKKNMNDAVEKNFFQMLSLFIEKFPKEIFTEEVLSIFLKIGRTLFYLVDQCGLSTVYLEHILLNEKIFYKFDIMNQIKMWNSILQFYVSDASQIKNFMHISKICFVLRYYDSMRYTKYCCKEHFSFFYTEEENKNKLNESEIDDFILNPDMKTKVSDLINIIQLIIDNSNPESEDSITLFKLLCLDLSPCLQNMILNIFINYFTNTSIQIDKKKKNLTKLLNNNFTDILLYVFSISLLDIRCQVINMLNILSNKDYNEIFKKSEEKIINFIKEFILPTNLLAIKEKSLNLVNSSSIIRERGLGVYSTHKQARKSISMLISDKNSKKDEDVLIDNIENENGEIDGDKEMVLNVNSYKTSKNVNRRSFKFDYNTNDNFLTNNREEEKIEIVINDKNKEIDIKDKNTEFITTSKEDYSNSRKSSFLFEEPPRKKSAIKSEKSQSDPSTPKKPITTFDLVIPELNPFTNLAFIKSNTFDLVIDSPIILNTLNDSSSIFNKNHKSDSHAIKSFSSVRVRKTLPGRNIDTDKMKIDIEGINKNYKFGGEKAELNLPDEEEEKELELKIRQLAKHCVDFITGTASSTDCNNSNFISHSYKYAINITPSEAKINNEDQGFSLIKNHPCSVKGTTKINFRKFSLIKKDKIIEEDAEEILNSPFKKFSVKDLSSSQLIDLERKQENSNEYNSNSIISNINQRNNNNNNSPNKNPNDLNEVKVRLSFDNLNLSSVVSNKNNKINSPSLNLKPFDLNLTNADVIQKQNKSIDIVDDYIINESKLEVSNFPNNNNINTIPVHNYENETESLELHFNKEIYSQQLGIFYDVLFGWLLNKNYSPLYSSSIFTQNMYLDDGDDIANPKVINVILKLALNSDVSYVQKLMQDFHLLLINNKENCHILYKNPEFYSWLIETSFKHFQSKNHEGITQDDCNTSFSIYELGKKIHTELIINTILKEEKLRSEPMNKIHFLLSWGVYYKNIYEHSRRIILDVNEFIKYLLRDILNAFKDKISTCSQSINLSIWENFISFTVLCYEYMTFYNLEKTMKNNSIGLAEMSYESIIVPRSILSGLNYQDPNASSTNGRGSIILNKPLIIPDEQIKDSLTGLWSDYKMFETIYTCYNKIWNFNKSILHNLNKNSNIMQGNLIIKYEKIIEELIFNKTKKDIFLDDLRILTYYYKSDFSNSFNNYDIPAIKGISNLMSITISLAQEESELKFWLEEYEQFLIFLIISSSNLSMNILDYYNLIQDLTIDTVVFGLCFLIDEYFNSRKSSTLKDYFAQCIRNVFVFCAMIQEYIYKQFEKKKKKINIFSNLMKKNKKIDFTKCAVYRIFNEYIVDKNGGPILNEKMIKQMKISQYVDVPQIFNKEIWRQGLTESTTLKEKLKKVFDFHVYEIIMRERNEVIRNFIPVYEHKFTSKNKNILSNLITVPVNNNLQVSTLKANLNKSIENILPNFEFEMKVYKNSMYVSSKQRRSTYRLLKKKLFTWRGMWSDRDLFFNHPDKLKLKNLNHYSCQFSRPILTPILDIFYYIPKFSKFDISNLFNKNENNLNYRISLDINNILDENENYNDKTTQKKNVKFDLNIENNPVPKQYNFIEGIFKLNNQQIWSKYSEINSKLELSTSKDQEYNELYLNRFKVKSSDVNLRKFENFYECCFVKASHHTKGIFFLNKEGITFRVISKTQQNVFNKNNNNNSQDNISRRVSTTTSPTPTNLNTEVSSFITKASYEIVDNDEDYNSERFTCWGSFFECHHKDNDLLNLNFPYSEIRYIFKRRYYYKKSAIEMFSSNNKSYYFNFKNFSDRENVMKGIMAYLDQKREIKVDTKENLKDKEDAIIGYENLSIMSPLNISRKSLKADYLSNKIESWMNWKISNFEFLMWLNIVSNRSFSDITQYPVFPWCLKNYTDSKITLPEDIRDFELPMGMMELDDKGRARKRLYMEDFRSMQNEQDEVNDLPRVYGSHYSNPIYVAHYLTRLFPYSYIMIELQGDRFDDPNRLFISMANSFSCATSLKGDVRELTPEFYYLPEFFLNLNDLNLGIRTDQNMNKQVVHNVELPEWCDNNPYEFIIKMRTALESEEVSLCINNWIDLIFGYKQKGKVCEAVYNLYPDWSYEDFNIDSVDKNEKASFLAQTEFGLTPSQLINFRPFNEKFSKDHIRRGRQLTESKDLKSYGNNTNTYKSLNRSNSSKKDKDKPLMLKIKVLDIDKVMCVFNNNTYNICRFTPNDYKYNMDITSKNYITNENVYKISNRIPDIYNDCLVNHPIIIYNSGKCIAQGGYFDGKIAVSYQEGNAMKLYYYCTETGTPIVTMAIDKEEQYVYAGSKSGVLYIFKINDFIWKLDTKLFDHNNEITFISVSNSLNIYATSSLDGFVNLYTFPSNRLFRSIALRDNISADYVFISCSPLPSFAVYSKLSKMFYCYSINGFLLCEEFEECKYIMSPIVLTDISFTDYLVYGTNIGDFKIRKFPNMILHHKLSMYDNKSKSDTIPIKCLDITDDKKFAYIWLLDEMDITLIKDPSVTSEAATVNLINMGFGY